MSKYIWFSSVVAQETLSVHAAILLERFHERSKVEGPEIVIDYKESILPGIPEYMDNRIHFKNTVEKLHDTGYGVLKKGAGQHRKPSFKLTKERVNPDNNIHVEYLSNKGIKRNYVHNLLCDLYPKEIELHEAALVRILIEESQDIISEQGVRKALSALVSDGYLTFEMGSNKGVVYKDQVGYKVYKEIKSK
ncbi:hypothetical protein COE01_17955 [Bacillus thuringiensis]|uniref:Uncharacterized protein n=1 Tax=Bacillus cereus TaxID=1396 RepID=A0AAW7NG18_BACCE|nr:MULTISPECIES: hypothetical protein [Bacillus]ATI60403.1 hypothetical protein CPZ31_16025 [Bacillus cereus]KXX92315.1 hypothetical protein AT266_06280 [Bacillus cereus]MBG9748558.1 hypothetical protein [Bacillus thuringiensis]MBG9749490.1 hypothetical protein [Bacillus thuringiensis]MBG9778335.1 hypothetical protein [Bacillus thuringiensis]